MNLKGVYHNLFEVSVTLLFACVQFKQVPNLEYNNNNNNNNNNNDDDKGDKF